jgi:hypothetical protein
MPTPTSTGEPDEERPLLDGSPLCLECGLCCHGVLHHYASLKEEEVGAAQALGLGVERERDYLGFALPCPKVELTRCTIYEHRLSTCSGYQCGLLRRYRGGNIALDDAVLLVREARRLFDAVLAVLPAGSSFRDIRWRWRKRMWGTDSSPRADDDAQRLAQPVLRITMLDRFLDRHFRLDRETTFDDAPLRSLGASSDSGPDPA